MVIVARLLFIVLTLGTAQAVNADTLQSKVAEITAACPGAHSISGYARRNVAGTRMLSCHAFGQAHDMVGPNPACIYSQLQNWPGGYSIDFARVGHVHISSCAREWGLRFRHGGGRKHRRR